jgi:transcriptional regulator PpsR
VRQFKVPQKTFGDLEPATVGKLVTASSDLALVLDKKGVIRDLALDGDSLEDQGCDGWVGKRWLDVVTDESRNKVEEMLAESRDKSVSRWRQVNHPAKDGDDIPIRYSVVKINDEGGAVALGRDLRPLAVLQQRLLGFQMQMEREYARLRQAETRYQTLFQLSSEAVVILDAASLKIAEANPAAAKLITDGAGRLSGRSFIDLLDKESAQASQTMLAALRSSARAGEIRVKLANTKHEFYLTASIFRQDSALYYLLRLRAAGKEIMLPKALTAAVSLQAVISDLPDGFVVINEDRRVMMANTAFLDLAQLVAEDQARGERIDRWLGRVDVDVDILIANLREHGSVRRFASVVRGEFGGREEIELSGVSVPGGELPCFGLVMRKAQTSVAVGGDRLRLTLGSFDQLKELIGRMSLRDLVRETTDIIEQMCIAAALELTGDNRASAAEMLGLSRQSFYVKLRRHGLGELNNQESH